MVDRRKTDTFYYKDNRDEELSRLRAENAKLQDSYYALVGRFQEDALLSTSHRCRTTHLQNCQVCEDLACGDNTSQWAKDYRKLRELVRLADEMAKVIESEGLGKCSEVLAYRKDR